MTRIAYVILCSCLLVFAALSAGPANAGDGYYRNGNYGNYGNYGDVAYRDGYNGGRYDRGRTYRSHPTRVWYSSNCCYRKIVRHVRAVRYVHVRPRHRYYGYYDRPHSRVSYYDVPPRRYGGYGGYAERDYGCHRRRVRAIGADGEWVWAVSARCY